MSNYITTYTGKHFEPTNPDQEAICIEDIAHALSLITRGNGHVKTLSDIPRPFKKELPEYCEHENHLLDLIYEKFLGDSLTAEEQVQLKAIDDALLWYDLTILLGEQPGGEAPKLQVMPDYAVRPFAEVEQEYLEMFRKYSR